MRLYLLERKKEMPTSYDCLDAVVVAAGNPDEARQVASTKAGDEKAETWLKLRDGSSLKSIGVYQGDRRTPFVVIQDRTAR